VIHQGRIASRTNSSLNCWSTRSELWLTKPNATAWDIASNMKLRTVSSGRVRKLKIADTVKLVTATMAIRHDTRGTEDALKLIRCLRASYLRLSSHVFEQIVVFASDGLCECPHLHQGSDDM
jgi:hypothetical protein